MDFLTAGQAETGAMGTWSMVLSIVLMLALFYFMLIRPQRKKEKEVTNMRKSIEVGDEVTTIGGIVGRVVIIKDDFISIATGMERNKIKFMRWAIQSKETKIEA